MESAPRSLSLSIRNGGAGCSQRASPVRSANAHLTAATSGTDDNAARIALAAANFAAAAFGSVASRCQAAHTSGALTLTVADMQPAKPALAAPLSAPSALGNTASDGCVRAIAAA